MHNRLGQDCEKRKFVDTVSYLIVITLFSLSIYKLIQEKVLWNLDLVNHHVVWLFFITLYCHDKSWKFMFFNHFILSLYFLIKICQLSIVVVVFVVVIVNFSHFHLLLQNHWTNFNQTWHKASLGQGESRMFKWSARRFSKGR